MWTVNKVLIPLYITSRFFSNTPKLQRFHFHFPGQGWHLMCRVIYLRVENVENFQKPSKTREVKKKVTCCA